jgi:HEAT repeat protein
MPNRQPITLKVWNKGSEVGQSQAGESCSEKMATEIANETQKLATSELRQIGAALEEFARAARQAMQYPSEHPISQGAIERARQTLLKLSALNDGKPVRITSSVGGLIVKGLRLENDSPALSWLNTSLRRLAIKALCLKPEVTTHEVGKLLELLNDESDTGNSSKDPLVWLAANDITNLEIIEQDYSRILRESEAALLQMAPGAEPGSLQDLVKHCMEALKTDCARQADANESDIDDTSTPPPELPQRLAMMRSFAAMQLSKDPDLPMPAESLPTILEELLVEQVSAEDLLAGGLANLVQAGYEAANLALDTSVAWQEQAEQLLWKLEPELRARLFRAAVVVSAGQEDALGRLVFQTAPQQIVADMVFSHPKAIIGENSASLDRLLRRIMPTAARQVEVEPLLQQQCLEHGMTLEVYHNVVGLLLNGLAKDQMMQLTQSGFHLNTAAQNIRMPTRADLADILVSLEPDKLAQARSEMLLVLLGHEFPLAAYATLCTEIATWSEYWRQLDEPRLAITLLRALAGEAHAPTSPHSHCLVAASTLARMATPELINWLKGIIARTPHEQQSDMIELLAHLGENTSSTLLELVLRSPDEALACSAAAIMCEPTQFSTAKQTTTVDFGNDLVLQGIDRRAQPLVSLLSAGTPDAALRIARLLLIADSSAAHRLAGVGMQNPQERVRIGLLRMLGEIAPAEAETALYAGLTDASWLVKAEAVSSLRKLCETSSSTPWPGDLPGRLITALLQIIQTAQLKTTALEVRLAAIELIGRLAEPSAVPTLIVLLQTRGWLNAGKRNQLHIACICALALIPTKQAEQALKKCCLSKNQAVAIASQRALARWQARFAANSSGTAPISEQTMSDA